MNPTGITSKQMPMVIILLVAAMAFVLMTNHCARTTDAEKAIKAHSLPRLMATLTKDPELLNMPDKKNGFTPLHWAVMSDQTNMVEFLLAKGATVNAADRYGLTPLHKAAAFNRVSIASLLMDKGANPLAYGIKYGVIRVAPIHLSAEAGSPELVKLFLDLGVDANLRTEGKNTVTPLHMASAKGKAEVVELLLKSGADVNARDVKNETPLHWALVADQEEVADMLRIYGGTE